MILLKDGWNYDKRDGEGGALIVVHRECFNVPQPPMFHAQPKKGGSRVTSENVKVELKVDFPSELIYALFSTITGLPSGGTLVPAPFHFFGAYVHIPSDWTTRTNQLILVYTLLWILVNEKNHNYTKGKIGFKEVDKL